MRLLLVPLLASVCRPSPAPSPKPAATVDAAAVVDAATPDAPPAIAVDQFTCRPIQLRCGGTDDYLLDCVSGSGVRVLHGAYATWMPGGGQRAEIRYRATAPRTVTITPHTCMGDPAPFTLTVAHEVVEFQRAVAPP